MKVTLFGATGKTGKNLIEEGLRRGFEMTVFSRPNSDFRDPRVHLVRGDLVDADLITDAILGSDAVLSALGPTSLRHPKDMPITRAMMTIVTAMKRTSVSRLVAISTGTAVDPGDRFEWKIRLPASLIRLLMPSSYRDIIGLAETIRASSLDWTMVRLPFLTDGPFAERLNVGLYGVQKHSMTVSRANVAAFMFDQIAQTDILGQAPGISTEFASGR